MASYYILYLFFLFLLLLLPLVSPTLLESRFYVGQTLVRFSYNNESISTCQVSLVGITDLESAQPTAWFTCLYNNGTTQFPTCRQNSQQQVVWGPIGCSNIVSPETAIQSGNCIQSEAELQRRLSIFLNTFYLSKDSVECYQLGGEGDIRLCPGPLRLSIPNRDPLVPISTTPPTLDYIASEMAFIEGGMGYQGSFKYTFEVPLVWPKITITRTSVSVCDDAYLGTYDHWQNDPSDLILEEVSKTFISESATTLRLLLRRVGGSESIDFQLVLADITGPSGSLYDFQWVSDTFVGDADNIFTNWVYQVQWGTAMPFYPYPSGAEACQLVLSVPSSYRPVLGPVPRDTTSDYMLNKQPRRYLVSNICSYRVCRPDDVQNEFYPNCPIGTKFGGDAVASHPLYPGLPIYVPPNPNSHFRLDCSEYYPKNETFRAYNINPSQGATVYRTNLESETCNAPFINPDKITLNLNPNEKYIQCHKSNGWVDINGIYCTTSITGQSPCPRGWIYWDQRCFYKFNPQTELRFQSTLENAQVTCRSLNPFASALVEVDEDTQLWLQNNFVYYKTSLDARAAFRTPSFDTSYCNCFLSPLFDDLYSIAPCGCFDTTVLDIYQVIFPICFFPITTAEMAPEMVDVGVSLSTAALLFYGQQGPNMGGFQLPCKCFNGMTFSLCTTTTCRVDVTASDAIGTFQRKCLEGQGQCANNQPSVCQCPVGRGPSASLFTSLPELYINKDWPCACPASGRLRGLYKINNQTYGGPIQDVLYLPCDGSDHGVCVVTNNTNSGTCVSVLRPNLQTNTEEPAYSGIATSCPNPIQPYKAITQNGPITTQFCNAKGTCCPGGQTNDNPYVGDPYAPECFSLDGDPLTGCECITGSGGPSCVCPTPVNLAATLRPESVFIAGVNYVFIDLKKTYFVRHIRLSPECPVPNSAQVSNAVGKGPPSSLDCSFNTTQGVYDCPASTLAYQYVVLNGTSITQNCVIEAFLDWFTLCGQNGTGNPFSGRFFDIPQYRARDLNLEPQYVGSANLGCTTTECMCNADWAGKLCAAGVSSIRPTYISGEEAVIETKYICGESTLVPDVLNPVQGRGDVDPIYNNCSCNPLSVADLVGLTGDPIGEERFVGRACQCALMKNLDRGDLEMCAGHGTCLEPDFPLGSCEKPLRDLAADPLSRPYADQSDFTIETVTDMLVAATSYVIADYVYTTSSPTAYPTTPQPTNAPTSPTPAPTFAPTSPTSSPTPAPTNVPTVLFFAASGLYTGASGISPTVCAPAAPPTCSPTTINQIKSISTRNINGGITYPDTAPVKAPTGAPFGPWSAVRGGMVTSPLASEGLPGSFWSGSTIFGLWDFSSSCNDFTTSSAPVTGAIGTGATTSLWYQGTFSCAASFNILCACETPTP